MEHRHLVEFFRHDACKQAQSAHDGAAHDGKQNRPRHRHRPSQAEKRTHGQHAHADKQAARNRRADIGEEKRPNRNRWQQNKHQIAAQARLNQRARGIGKRVLRHRHHRQARNQKRGIAHAWQNIGLIFHHMPKNQLVEQRGNHGRENGLKAHFPKAQDFFFQQGRKAS